MRLLMFDDGSGRRLGALRDGTAEQVVDLAALAAATGATAPPSDLLSLIDEGDGGLEAVGRLLSRLDDWALYEKAQ